MNGTSKRSHRRAFALWEVLFVLTLVVVGMNLTFRTVVTLVRLNRELPAAADALRSQQQWLDRLREDAWAANRVEATDASLALAASTTVRWTIDADSISRADNDSTAHWPLSAKTTFAVADGVLSVRQGEAVVGFALPSLAKAVQP